MLQLNIKKRRYTSKAYFCYVLCRMQFSIVLRKERKIILLKDLSCTVIRKWQVLYSQLSFFSGHCRDLELVSSLARVRNSGALFQSNVCKQFLVGTYSCCLYYQSVRYSGVSGARRMLTVYVYCPRILSSCV